jgi:ribosome maturation factor RimP
VLDVEDFIQTAYALEISSPGLERELYKLGDYERFAGSLAKLKTDTPLGGQRNFRGRIAGVNENRVIFQDRTKGLVEIPFAMIAKARLEIDLQEELRRK